MGWQTIHRILALRPEKEVSMWKKSRGTAGVVRMRQSERERERDRNRQFLFALLPLQTRSFFMRLTLQQIPLDPRPVEQAYPC